jgi:hypothetical protein
MGWNSNHKCKECGKKFDHYARGDKEYCDATCRKRGSRRRGKLESLECDTAAKIAGFLEYLDHPDFKPEARTKLVALYNQIAQMLKDTN